MQDGLHHAQRLVVSLGAAPDLVNTQRLKEAVDVQQQRGDVNVLQSAATNHMGAMDSTDLHCMPLCQHGASHSTHKHAP